MRSVSDLIVGAIYATWGASVLTLLAWIVVEAAVARVF